MEERHNDQTVQGIKQFVSKLPHMLAVKKQVTKRRFHEVILKLFVKIYVELVLYLNPSWFRHNYSGTYQGCDGLE
jgi:hypothetical protein